MRHRRSTTAAWSMPPASRPQPGRFCRKLCQSVISWSSDYKEAQATEVEILGPQFDKLDSAKVMIADVEAEADQVAREMRAIPEARHSGATYKALEKQTIEIDERYAGLLRARDKIEVDIATA